MSPDVQQNLEILAYVAVAMIMIVWIVRPLFRSARADHDAERDMVNARVQSLLSSLRTLNSENSKVTDEDRKNIERRLYRELASIYESQGIQPTLEASAEEVTESKICQCGQPLKPSHKFCPACGTAVSSAA